uniref:C2H2-type domain-containing protein n=1 Tax=Leptocylindrus danicus TaxID=163516 RepID=A0A7S2L2K0_9STRA|mmetsp:Transcript_30017/g.44121  ORF Transcript_30017/g.44121 Transcript_30017/m.44121 type:complete len:229 (+) Transcript_30017:26-712(+)
MPKSENKTKIRCSLCKRKFTSVEKLRRHENLSEMHKENLAKAAAAEKETEAAVARSLTTCTVISKPDAVVPTKASRSSVPDPASVSRDDKKNSAVEIQPIEGLGEEDIEDSKPKAKAKPTPKRKKTADWENKKVDENCSISSTGRLTRSTRARKGTNSTPVEKTQALDDASASTTRRVTRRMGNAIEETKPATEESKLNTSEVGRKRRGGNAIEEKKACYRRGQIGYK